MKSPAARRHPLIETINGPVGSLLLVLLVIVCYAQTISFNYIWDDDQYVTDNLTLRSFAGLSRIWTDIAASPQYYPVTLTSFWLEVQALGAFRPGVSHAINFILHALSVVMLFRLLRQLHVPGAWLAAAIFAVHPINVESVAWITERKNALSLTFGLASLLVYFRYTGLIAPAAPPVPVVNEAGEAEPDPVRLSLPTEPGRLYGLFLFLFIAALLAKTTLAVLPGVILVIVWWKRGRLRWADWRPLVAPIVLGLAAGLLTSYIERSPLYVGARGPEWDLGIGRLALAGQTALFYVGKVLLPHPFIFYKASWAQTFPSTLAIAMPDFLKSVLPWPLMFNYPRWTVHAGHPLQWIATVAVLGAIVAALLLRRRVGRGLLAGILLYLGCLLPASGLFNVYPMRFSWVADHFAYVAAIPLIVLIVAGIAIVWRRTIASATFGAVASGLVIALLGTVTIVHGRIFADQKVLWEATLLRNNQSWLSAVNFGAYLIDQGREAWRQYNLRGDQAEARRQHDRLLSVGESWLKLAIRRNPNTYEGYYQLAQVALERGDGDRALALIAQSQELAEKMGKESFLQPRMLAAQLLKRKGDAEAAGLMYRELQDFEPAYASKRPLFFAAARSDYGNLLLQGLSKPISPDMSPGDGVILEKALDQFNQAILLAPAAIEPKVQAARIIIESGGPLPPALQLLNDALRIDRNRLDARYLAGVAGLQGGEYEAAGAQLQDLVNREPRYLPPYVKLAEAYDAVGKRPEAIATLEQALRLQPDYKPAMEKLAELKGASTQPGTMPSNDPATGPMSPPAMK